MKTINQILLWSILITINIMAQDRWYAFEDNKSNLIGYKDNNGTVKIEAKFSPYFLNARKFDKIIAVIDKKKDKPEAYYLLKSGKIVGRDMLYIFDNSPDCESEGFIRFKDKNSSYEGMFDSNGNVVIEAKYNYLTPVHNGLVEARKGAKKVYANKHNNGGCNHYSYKGGTYYLLDSNGTVLIKDFNRSLPLDLFSMKITAEPLEEKNRENFKGVNGKFYSFINNDKAFNSWFFSEFIKDFSKKTLLDYMTKNITIWDEENGWIKKEKSTVVVNNFKRIKAVINEISEKKVDYFMGSGYSIVSEEKEFNQYYNNCRELAIWEYPVYDVQTRDKNFYNVDTFTFLKTKDGYKLVEISMRGKKEKQSLFEKDYTSKQLENFKKKFAPHALPKTLIELIKFDDSLTENSYYSQSFYLNDDNEEDFFETWLDNGQTDDDKRKEYAKSMIVFARADDTGGAYAMWIQEGNTNLEEAPIISYGSEGEITVVASNLKDLIKMLSFGAEGMEGSFHHSFLYDDEYEKDQTYFYREFAEDRPNFLKFRKWMKETLDIYPVNIECLKKGECDESGEIKKLVKKAQKKYKKVFDKWQYQFYPNPKDAEVKKLKEFKEKKKNLLSQLKKNPTGDLYFLLSENEKKSKEINWKQYDEYFEKALKLSPNHIGVLQKLALENEYDNPKKSIAYYLKLIKIHDKPEKFYFNIAYTYDHDKQYKKALEYHIKDTIVNKSSITYVLHICEKLKKDPIPILEDIVEKMPKSDIYWELSHLYFAKKNYTKASTNAVKSLEFEYTPTFGLVSNKLLKEGLYKEALPVLEILIARGNVKVDTYQKIGLCYLSLSNLVDAFNAYKKAYNLDKKEIEIHKNLYKTAQKLYVTKNLTKAKEVFEFCLNNFDYEKENIEKYLKVIEDKLTK